MHKMSYYVDRASGLFSGLWQEGFWQITSPLSGVVQKKNFSFFLSTFHYTIVNRADWLGSAESSKGTNKDAKIYVGRSTTQHNLLFSAQTLCVNYVTTRFYWLVPQFEVNNYFVLSRVKAKKANKNIKEKTLTSFIAILLY